MAKKSVVKFDQVGTHIVNVSDIMAVGNMMVLPDAAKRAITILEARHVRQALGATGHTAFKAMKQEFVLAQNDDGTEVKRKVLVADMFIIVKVDQVADSSDMIEAVFAKGFVSDGHLYKYVMSSPAQDRTSKAVFTALDPDQVRRDVTYNALEFQNTTTPIVLAKREARYGIGMSSTKEIIGDFNYLLIKDAYADIMIDGKIMGTDQHMKPHAVSENTNLTDGQGYCTIKQAAFMAFYLDIITFAEYNAVKHAFMLDMLISDMIYNDTLSKIIAKIPMVWQIRYAGAKGILVVWEFRGHEVQGADGMMHDASTYDVLFTEGMWKYTPDPNYHLKPTLEVASWIKRAQGPGYLNYQFIQGLNITAETLISIAKDALDYLENGVLQDYDKAMKFLGAINYQGDGDEMTMDDNGDTDFEKISTRSKVVEALMRNPRALRDKYIQKNLRLLCRTFIEEMRKGRIPLDGSAFRFVVRDPAVTFGGVPNLGLQEAYYNGHVGNWAAFRSPAIHRSEYVVMNMVNKHEYAHLVDCVIINAHNDWAARMGGMDFDGDKVFLTKDQRIVAAVPGGKVIFAEGDAAKGKSEPPKFVPTWNNIIYHKVSTLGQDMIGILTNIATTVTDRINCGKIDAILGNEYVEQLRVLQGMAIDSAKTGDRVNLKEYPQFDDLRKMQPHWMEPGNPRTIKYTSGSPIGQLYSFIMGADGTGKTTGYLNEFLKVNKMQGGDFRLDMPHILDLEEVQKVKPIVKLLEEQYCEEIALMMANERSMYEQVKKKDNMSEADVEDFVKRERKRIYEKYSQVTSTISGDPRSIAGAAYLISYGKDTDSVSFPWVACKAGMMMLMSDLGKDISYKLVPIHTEEDLSERESIVVMGGKAADPDTFEPLDIRVNVADGTYPVVIVEERWFVKAPFVLKPMQSPYQVGNRIVFQIKGFEFFGTDGANALSAILTASGHAELRTMMQNDMNRLVLYVNGKPIAATQFSAREYDEFAVTMFNGNCIQIDVANLKAQMKNPKLKFKGLYTLDAAITACRIDAQQALDDAVVRSVWYWEMERVSIEELGFTDVSIRIHDELGADKEIGVVTIKHSGSTYHIPMMGVSGFTVKPCAEMSDRAKAFLCQAFSEELGAEVRRRRLA